MPEANNKILSQSLQVGPVLGTPSVHALSLTSSMSRAYRSARDGSLGSPRVSPEHTPIRGLVCSLLDSQDTRKLFKTLLLVCIPIPV